jgi:carbonic anhydrase
MFPGHTANSATVSKTVAGHGPAPADKSASNIVIRARKGRMKLLLWVKLIAGCNNNTFITSWNATQYLRETLKTDPWAAGKWVDPNPAIVSVKRPLNTMEVARMKKSLVSADDALRMLKEGNARFVQGGCHSPRRDHERRILTSTEGQTPFAAVLACSDSRVPVSAIFDQGIGDIFTVRVAGNVAGDSEIGSMEYAVAHLGVPLLVIMGHSQCGAVQAAVSQGNHSVRISKLIEKIAAAVSKTVTANADITDRNLLNEIARTNVSQQIKDLLGHSEIVGDAVEAGHVLVMGAFYDICTGHVEWMDAHPQKAEALGNAELQSACTAQVLTRMGPRGPVMPPAE